MKKEIISMGEILIDFIASEKGTSLYDAAHFDRYAGGAPANVAVAAAKLGSHSSIITQVGFDKFGDYLFDTLKSYGVDTSKIFRSAQGKTGIAFVASDKNGKRSFSFYRDKTADTLLDYKQIYPALFSNCGIFHFCSMGLADSPLRNAHERAIKTASDFGAIISFDPNIRENVFPSYDACRNAVETYLPLSHIIKLSEEDMEFLWETSSEEEAQLRLLRGKCKLVILTRGDKGCVLINRQGIIKEDGIKVPVYDATGAGDAFMGAFLHRLIEDDITVSDLENLSSDKLQAYMIFANFYASYTTMKRGTIEAMASKSEIEEFIKNDPINKRWDNID